MMENEVTVWRSAPNIQLTTATEAATGHSAAIITPSATTGLAPKAINNEYMPMLTTTWNSRIHTNIGLNFSLRTSTAEKVSSKMLKMR